jgi:hypothetical protein
MEPVNVTEFGVTGIVLIVLFWVMKFASDMLSKKTGNGRPGNGTCLDPIAKQQIRELHTMTTDTEKQKDSGHFNCAWRGRDEVRDLMEIMRQLVHVTEELTLELRLTRNGSGKR